MASSTTDNGTHGYTPERLQQMETAFKICATLDRARFPLAATLLAESDSSAASASLGGWSSNQCEL